MHIALYLAPNGFHFGGWRHPAAKVVDPLALKTYVDIAQTAERGKLDMVFIADKLAIDDIYGNDFAATVDFRTEGLRPEPWSILSALVAVTSKIGLAATVSTSYVEPYHAARSIAMLDHLSGGRIGWNAVTSTHDGEARNLGKPSHYDHATRYGRAEEFIDVVRKLNDTWDDDALLLDPESGRYADATKVRYLDHQGEWFKVRGPLSVPRPPQGQPVLIQAGASGAFKTLAAQKAEAIFAVLPHLRAGQDFYKAFKGLVKQYGRPADAVKVLSGLIPIIGDTEEQARALSLELNDLVLPIAGLSFMSGSMNYDLSQHPLDELFPDILDRITGSRGRFEYVIKKVRDEGLTLRQVGKWYAGSGAFITLVGTASQVAEQMTEWVAQRGCDGFVLMPPYMPGGLDDFVDKVVPELQARGAFRKDYTGDTLRDHLGLARPMRQDIHL
jgi:FMN-dependent oxidoreductase (nitrilotriacetate monooxygenase family)